MVNTPSMFDILISAPNYEVYPCFLFYDHITILLVLPHICPLLTEYTTDADTMFIEEFIHRGVVAKLSSILSCAQITIRVFMLE